MKIFLTVIFIFILSNICIYAQKTQVNRITTLQILKKREPKVQWNSHSLLKADFDYDGIVDYALSAKKGKLFVIGIMKGAITSKFRHSVLEFSEDAGSQNALCSVANARISLERFLDDDEIADVKKLPKTSRGINLSDGSCDALHIYYDQNEKQFVWWRR